ncbi:MAG: sigma-54 dependent transcriptional regulator [Candidatus Brocadiia bacterium]
MSPDARILVADDDAAMRDSCRQVLEREGLSIEEAADGDEALQRLAARAYELVLLDLKMPGTDGMDVLKHIKDRHNGTAVVVITGYPSIDTAVEAMKLGATDFLPKPFSRESLTVIVQKALDYTRLEEENRRLRRHIEAVTPPTEIVGETPEMRRIYDLMRRVAPTDSTVLLTGESGTGKELVARALHANSKRASGPFVVVDCATLVGTLFENELFGHAKGSYTGATSTTHGRFELANGGTLFLDEVGCIEPGMQQKLLRVLEQREFTRVGSNQIIHTDVRVIAATNTDLEKAVAAGSFREDLYYRLSVFPIKLPPLRERKADIPLLAEHFLRLHCDHRQKEVSAISPEAVERLMAHDWPGNVRELSNVIERAVVLAEGGCIRPEHLLNLGSPDYDRPAAAESPTRSLDEVERRHIRRVLDHTDGNKTRAADILGIDRKTLWRKLQAYDGED